MLLLPENALKQAGHILFVKQSYQSKRIQLRKQRLFKENDTVKQYNRRSKSLKLYAQSGDRQDNSDQQSLAPVQPQTPFGQMLQYYLKMQPELFYSAVDDQYNNLAQQKKEQDEASKAEKKDKNKSGSDNQLMVSLNKRIQEQKQKDFKATVQDLMYLQILEKFVKMGANLFTRIDKEVGGKPTSVNDLIDQVGYTKDAVELVKEHILALLGPQTMMPSQMRLKLSKVKAAQIYFTSILFGYFLRKVDRRYSLEKSLGILLENDYQSVSNLEELLRNTASYDSADDPDSPSQKNSQQQKQQQIKQQQQQQNQQQTPKEGEGISEQNILEQMQKQFKEMSQKGNRLKDYIKNFDQQTAREMSSIVSKEGIDIVDRQIFALFGNYKVMLQDYMTELQIYKPVSQEEWQQFEQDAINQDRVQTVTLTIENQRRLIIEAATFGSFLRDVESHVNEEYQILTPSSQWGMGGAGGTLTLGNDPSGNGPDDNLTKK